MEKSSVPKFGSFKPKAALRAPTAQEELPDRNREASGRSHRPDRKDRSDRHGHRSSSRRDRHNQPERDRRLKDKEVKQDHSAQEPRHHRRSRTPGVPQNEPEAADDLFMIDRRGDAKNVEYGGLHRYSIPAYHRTGYGRVLGGNRHVKIDRDASTDKGLVLELERGKRAERLLTKKNLRPKEKGQRVILPQSGRESPAEFQLDFVALGTSLKRKRGSESPEPDLVDVDYRSVEGKAKEATQPDDGDLEFESDSDDDEEAGASDARIRTATAELSRATKTDPTNVDAWLALSEHQAKSNFPDLDPDELTSAQRRSVADLRLSILDQALKYIHAGDVGHDRILLAYIDEGAKVWDASKLVRKWKDALKKAPTSLPLWKRYLSYVQTDYTTFRFETCKDAYLHCLKTLRNNHDKAPPEQQTAISNMMVYILLRLTRFIADAGYDELAITIWQAVLEYHLFAPEWLSSRKLKMEALEEFWESDAPRIGEDGATGWRSATSDAKPVTRKTAPAPRNTATVESGKPYTSFALAEKLSMNTFLLPAATADMEQEDEEDPFRYVLFSDIELVLESLPDLLDVNLLIDAFLCFMHLPPVQQDREIVRDWQSDPFLQCGNVGINTARSCDGFALFNSEWATLRSSEETDFVRSTLSMLSSCFRGYEELGEYRLAFVCHAKPTEIARMGRLLLKARPMSLQYWNAYALSQVVSVGLEEELDKAEGIWTKAFGLAGSLAEGERDDEILLWHSWVMTLLHRGDDDGVLRLLLTVADGPASAIRSKSVAATPAAGLRARRRLEESADRMRLKQKYHHSVLHAECLAYLLYLLPTPDVDIESALAILKRATPGLSTSAGEQLEQAKARLLSLHMKAKRPFRPTVFRDVVAESRTLFPENALILQLYHELGAFTRVDDRMRDALGEAKTADSQKGKGLVAYSLAIGAEIFRFRAGGATRENVRALFRKALLSPDSKLNSSLLLWRRWFDFERSGAESAAKAREVFFNGLRCLPWSKAWVVEGMASCGLDENELGGLYDGMMGRELRVRCAVDGV